MADPSQSTEKKVSVTSDTQPKGLSLENKVWIVILITYLTLFFSSGYIAFLRPQYNPALSWNPAVEQALEDENKKSFVIEALKQEGESFKKQRDLAGQSFNVVLGALLGFLSASAAAAIRRRQTPDQDAK